MPEIHHWGFLCCRMAEEEPKIEPFPPLGGARVAAPRCGQVGVVLREFPNGHVKVSHRRRKRKPKPVDIVCDSPWQKTVRTECGSTRDSYDKEPRPQSQMWGPIISQYIVSPKHRSSSVIKKIYIGWIHAGDQPTFCSHNRVTKWARCFR